MKRFSAQEARDKLADILGIVYYSGEPVVVEKRGRPVAVVIHPDDYEMIRKEREGRFQVLDRIWEKADKDTSPEEIERLVNEEVHALRKERRGQKGEDKEGTPQ